METEALDLKQKEVIFNSFPNDASKSGGENTDTSTTIRFNAIKSTDAFDVESVYTPRTRAGAATRTTSRRRTTTRARQSGKSKKADLSRLKTMTKRKKITFLIVSVLLLFFLISSCKFLFLLGNPLIGGDIDEEIKKAQDAVKNDMVSVLLIGTDGGGYNTDTIMLAVMNCKSKEISLISIPRDTRVPNPYGGSGYAKINSVYAAKGMAGLISQVKAVTGMPVNFYAMIDFEGFREAIDVLGGVEFNVPQRMKYYDPVQDLNIDLYPGVQILDGDKAEQLVRCRNIYAQADLARTEVQRNFIKATIEQHATVANLTKLGDLYKTLEPYVKTSVTLGDALKYGASVTGVKSDRIYSYMLPGAAGSYGSKNISYFIYDAEEVKALANEIGYGEVEVVRLPAPTMSSDKKAEIPEEEEDKKEDTKEDSKDKDDTSKTDSDENKKEPADAEDKKDEKPDTSPKDPTAEMQKPQSPAEHPADTQKPIPGPKPQPQPSPTPTQPVDQTQVPDGI